MTSIDTWSPWIAIIVTGGWSLLAAAGLAFSLYLSNRQLDAIKEALKNSRYVYIWGPSLGKRGFIWSLLEISKIAGMVVWPWASLRIGELDPIDLKNFPTRLKRLLIIDLTIMIISCTWMGIAVVLIKFK
ncbi:MULTISPECIES: hypothetical protein [Pseudomonas]|jgi:hypothetical protein|uniref:Uncharacterized protein n=1 Tax=Pseudomonas kielensis TaxID=2762577 RepID=A0A7X1GKA8_9PSED|nr:MULTISPECIES: hypothetical protein [Pseudomonas]MBC2693453.1 hypothetical protein [Pseudomonas kielensis]NBB37150.1 hypothetical protein [Pseudomonas sp. BC115LW]UZM15428.1 hypothetical protein LZV00_06620 [Pseudomonas kielensis]WKL52443.1 hypothetical protein Q1W70_23905 [Pseudomonas kielensis]